MVGTDVVTKASKDVLNADTRFIAYITLPRFFDS